MRTSATLGVVLAGVLVLGGCTSGGTDEDAAPEPTAATTPAPMPSATSTVATTTALPRTVPAGDAGIEPRTPVWVQGTVLHVGLERVDLAPRRVDAFVSTRGGVYFLDGGELWFTDLQVVRGAGLAGVTALAADSDGSSFRVVSTGGTAAYEVGEGRRIAARLVHPLRPVERLGRPSRVALRPERSDVSSTQDEVPARLGSGSFGVVDVEGGPLVAFDTTDDLRVPLTGVLGSGFELVAWDGPSAFHGLALEGGRPLAVLGCDLEAGSCRSYGDVDPDTSLLLESGT